MKEFILASISIISFLYLSCFLIFISTIIIKSIWKEHIVHKPTKIVGHLIVLLSILILIISTKAMWVWINVLYQI